MPGMSAPADVDDLDPDGLLDRRRYEPETVEEQLEAISARLEDIQKRVGFPWFRVALIAAAAYVLGHW